MKVYFGGLIRGGRLDQSIYEEFIGHAKSRGVEVLCEHFDTDASANLSEQQIHDRDLAWIDESSAMIAEVTQPNLGTGYKIRYAVDGYKPILALFNEGSSRRLSAMIEGSRAEIYRYRRTETGMLLAKTAITEFLHCLEYKDLRH